MSSNIFYCWRGSFLLFLYYFVSLFIFVFSILAEDFYFLVFSLCSLYVVSAVVVKNPAEPLLLVGIFWLLYVLTFPLGVYFLERVEFDERIVFEVVKVGAMGFLGFVLGCIVFGARAFKSNDHLSALLARYSGFDNLSLLIAFAVSVVFFPFYINELLSTIGTSASHKFELERSSGSLMYIFLFSTWIFFAALFARVSGLKAYLFLFLFLLIFLVYYLFTGQRDFLVRAGMFVVFYLLCVGRVNFFVVWFVVVVGVLSQPLLQAGKGLFSFGGGDFLFGLDAYFSGEFISQGRNFYYILDRLDTSREVLDGSLLNDIKRFFYFSDSSSTNNFSRNIMEREGGPGLGFSLLAQFYISGGVFAVFAFGFFSALILRVSRYFYTQAPIGVFIYVTTAFAFGYSLRGDFAALLANVVKLGFLICFVYFCFVFFVRNAVMERSSKVLIK